MCETAAADHAAMAGITLAQAEARLAEYLAAESAVLSAQDWSLNGKRVTRADLAAIQAGIKLWDERAKALSASAAGAGRTRVLAPNW